ncbi:MAG: type IV pilus twitching motility protein PilT [Xanthomonadales bacterium]|nr:type IV pilus twitching motility protein PilT [Gammaproteobacteria bacterium]NNE04354.1 type IV pilus twitching motility protein PilT [Xanthomonadales bacterium]NNL94110.1 type IV pilus twitching motility protein PilT [Xanthomonadales bacterium]
MAKIDELFRYLNEQQGSDLHLLATRVPRVRIHGQLTDVEGRDPLSNEELECMLREIATPQQWDEYQRSGDLDFAWALPGECRFRVNFLRQHLGAAAVFRIIPETILTFDQLDLPQAVRDLAHLERGLVLVTGPTGSGKSTTLAAIVNEINEHYQKHIVTIEDPVEFVHQNKQCTISQREVEQDTRSFSDALRVTIRQDTDVILVGEMRDMETIELAITAAEMGSLVFGTLHTNSATKTIDRLIDAFPASRQEQIRTTLADSICAIVSQQLLPTADGEGRCAAHEIMLRTNSLPNIIREGNTTMLVSVIQGGMNHGMCSMDDSLAGLVKKRKITATAALSKAKDKKRFQFQAQQEQAAENAAPDNHPH